MSAVFAEMKAYLLSLKDSNQSSLYLSRRKTFVIGFVCTSEALIMFAKDLFSLKDCPMTCLPPFTISQDFIENLFS
jgi:hypothetical protein